MNGSIVMYPKMRQVKKKFENKKVDFGEIINYKYYQANKAVKQLK